MNMDREKNALIGAPPAGEPWICPKCTARGGGHYLTCATLQLPGGWAEPATPSFSPELGGGDWTR